MKKAILVAIIGAMTLGVNAGDWGKAPVGKAPIEECIDLGGEITVGYMSDYFYRGYHLATGSVYGDVNYTFDGLAIPITIGAWYLNGVDHPITNFTGQGFDELRVYASAALGTFAGFEFNLGYLHHFYPEGANLIPNGQNFGAGDDIGEVTLEFSRDLGFATLVGSANYALDETNPAVIGFASDMGFYGNIGLERAFGITDNISLVLGGGVGYVDIMGSSPLAQRGWNHYYLQASLPIQLNCRTTLTPYVGYNHQNSFIANSNPVSNFPFPLPVDNSVVHGGVSLSVTF